MKTVLLNKEVARIALAALSDTVGAVEEDTLGLKGPHDLNIYFRDHHDLVFGITLEDFKRNVPALIEIEAMSCTIPMEIMFKGDDLDRAAIAAFLKDTFNEVTEGKLSAHGYKIRALINPSAVDSVSDEGSYRDIHLKTEFEDAAVLHTAIPAQQLTTTLRLDGPR